MDAISTAQRGAFGMGDVKLMAAAGAVVGTGHILPFLFAMTLAGGVIALGYLVAHRGARATMPYGPAIAVATAWIVLVAR